MVKTKLLVYFVVFLLVGITAFRMERPQKQEKPFTPAYIRILSPANFMGETFGRVLPEPHASLLEGMTVGVQKTMPREFYTNLRRTGTIHLVAVSGYNISLVVAAALGIFVPLLGRRLGVAGSLAAVFAYVWFTGFSPSAVRAGLMAGLSLMAIFFGRQGSGFWGLILAFILMVVFSPPVIFDLGFQLSFAATLGIMLAMGRWSEQKSGFFEGLKKELLVIFSATAFTFPIIALNFHQISLISFLANLLVSGAVPVVMVFGGVIGIAGVFFLPLAEVLAWFVWPVLTYFIAVINFLGSLPWAMVEFK